MKKLSKSTAVVLAGIIWTALVSFPITAKAQSSNGEASLKKFLQGYFAPKDEDKKTRYIAAFHDLNGDGTPEALVYISGPGWCGSGGCKLYVLTPAGSSWTIVARTTITWPPIRVLASRSHGWHNLAVSVGGGGIQPGYEAFASVAKSILAIRLPRPPVEQQKMHPVPLLSVKPKRRKRCFHDRKLCSALWRLCSTRRFAVLSPAMQLKQAVDAAYQLFIENDVPSPRLNAELLLLFVLNRERAYLYAHPERELSADDQSRYDEVIRERARGCPTQYITGHQEFWGLDLLVSPAVLIPRPETEHVVETVLELLKEHPLDGPGRLKLLDVGTGSGCIALALASELPNAEIHACDISDDALEMARTNAARLCLGGKVLFRKSDLLSVYSGEKFDFIISNPPYVGEVDADKVQKQVREFEPKIAVFSGREGMEIYRRLIPQAHDALNPGGWFVAEIGYSEEEKVRDLLDAWSDVQVTADLQGIPRVIAARKSKTK